MFLNINNLQIPLILAVFEFYNFSPKVCASVKNLKILYKKTKRELRIFLTRKN